MAPAAGIADTSACPGPWGEPDPTFLRKTPPPAIWPREFLPAFWQGFVEAAADGASAAADYVGSALLVAAGMAIGNSHWAEPWPGWTEPSALFCALVGNPSSGKSPALDVITSILAEVEQLEAKEAEPALAAARHEAEKAAAAHETYRKKLREAARTRKEEPEAPPPLPKTPGRPRLLAHDTTVERATRLSADNPRGLILLRDELCGFFGSFDRYTSGAGSDRAFWLQAHGGRPFSADRVGTADDPPVVPHLLWGIMGGIQPDKLASALLGGSDDGLAARFLYSWPEPPPIHRPRGCADIPAAVQAFRRLRSLAWPTAPHPAPVPFTEPARQVMDRFRQAVRAREEHASGLMLGWIGKLPGMAARLALILTALRWCADPAEVTPFEEIDEAAFTAAAAWLLDYALPHAARAFGVAALPAADRDARTLAKWLVSQTPIPAFINERELRRLPIGIGPGIGDPKRLLAALESLADGGWVAPPSLGTVTTGRPRRDWRVNPAIADLRP